MNEVPVKDAASYAAPPPPPPLARPVLPPSRISFTNGRAVRITLAVAGCSLLAIGLIANLVPQLLFPILVAAGFASARVYSSGSAESVSAGGGAALGAMTWLWLYLLEAAGTSLVVFTAQGREIVKTLKNPDLAQFIDDPSKLVPTLLVFLLVGTISGALGGVLGARWQPRSGPSH